MLAVIGLLASPKTWWLSTVDFPSSFLRHSWQIFGSLFLISAPGRVSPHPHLAPTPARRAAAALRTKAASGSRGVILLVIKLPSRKEIRKTDCPPNPGDPVREYPS